MARDLPTAVATAIAQPVVRLAFFAEFQFASGTLRVWTGAGNKSWSAQTWSGVGEFAGLSPVDETTEIGAAGLTFSLNGISSSLLALALDDAYRGRACKLWLAILDANDAVVDAHQIFAGRMDVMSIVDGGETGSITLQAENRLVDLTRARSLRYTDAEQQRLFPGDLGCAYVAKLAEKPIYWGVAPPHSSSSGSFGGGGGAGSGVVRLN